MTTQNATAHEARMKYELELVDDAFCDIYSHYPDATSHLALGRAIDLLQKWRQKYGMTYNPGQP